MNLKKSYQTLKEYRGDPLNFIVNLEKQQGHRMTLDIFGKKLILLSHPNDVLHVLKTNNSAYTKGRTTKALRQFLGRGLITNEGDSWRRQHRLSRPIMSWKSVYQLAPKILETSQTFVASMENGYELNSFHEMNRLTWRIVLKTLFSQEPTPEMDFWLEDILLMMKIITGKTRSSIPVPFWIPTNQHRILKRIIMKFDQYVYGMIGQRREGKRENDFLQLLINAQEEGTAGMTDREIRDEVMTFLMAGHETITNTMSWALIELAKNPHYKTHLRIESQAFFETGDFEVLNSSPWYSAVIDEVMRLWPPVWVFMRQAEAPDQIDSLYIPKNANVVVSPYLSHRSADFWENPENFHPERFLPENRKKIINGSFYPFGLGPRACIGANFATIEAKIILATLIHECDWNITQVEEQKSEAGITLRPINNIMMTFKRHV